MEVVEVLERMGGIADAHRLVRLTSRRRVAEAVALGGVVRDARGRYALPGAVTARREAHRLHGVVTGLSAAVHHGWEVKTAPTVPIVTVPAKRRVPPARRAGADVRWRDIPPDDVWDGVLRPAATVVDCARSLPFDEALTVADSALRHGAVTQHDLLLRADQVATRGRAAALRVAREASGKAANPFESVLRAIGLGVAGLHLEPQVTIREHGWSGRPDLLDRSRRLVVEADSFEFHGRRAALRRDCERYTALALLGWTVLRFSWEHVMLAPDYVAACLTLVVEGPRAEEQVILPRPGLWRPSGDESPVRRYASRG